MSKQESKRERLPLPETPEDYSTAMREGGDNLPPLLKAYRDGGPGPLSRLIDTLDEDSAKWTLMAAIIGAAGMVREAQTAEAALAQSTEGLALN
jgi:hypothetical protein